MYSISVVIVHCTLFSTGKRFKENIENTTTDSKHDPSQFHDIGINVNMELNENKFLINWPDLTKLKRVNKALFTITLFVVLFVIFGLLFPNFLNNEKNWRYFLLFVIILYVASTVTGQIISTVSDMPFVGMTLAGMAIGNNKIFMISEIDIKVYWFYIRYVKSRLINCFLRELTMRNIDSKI